jgi:two-component system chemotaxis response regulator CheY
LGSPKQNLKILLVDDFEMVRMMLRNTLIDLGFSDIHEAEDGRAALTMIKTAEINGTPFKMVFCDWSMPEMTGIEVLEYMRSQPKFKTVPFVMVTAEAEQDCVVRAIRAGANEYLIKPISAESLQKKITKILGKETAKAA